MTEIAQSGSGDASQNYYLAYLTANDGRDFSIDYLNFRNMARHPPGVPCVEVTIAISQVRPFSSADARQIFALVHLASSVPWLRVRTVIWKGNIGRDFSSAEACLRSLAESAYDDDFVLIRNRSGYGPFSGGWYSVYIDQFRRHANSGLVGSTMHLSGPPNMPQGMDPRHVQTYVYLSQWRHFSSLLADFPGRQCTDSPGAILYGELGLSHRIMAQGLSLSCLHWPGHVFTSKSSDDPALPLGDIKSEVAGLPFRYKFPAYRRAFTPQLLRLFWMFATYMPWFWRRTPTASPRQLHLNDYDSFVSTSCRI